MASQFRNKLLERFPRRFITPIMATLALVISASGVLMFFHLGEGVVKSAHEWLGIVFVLVMLVHMLSNWKALGQHFRQGVARSGAAAVLLATGLLLGAGVSSEPGGPELVFRALQEAPVTTVAELFMVDEEILRQELARRGVATDSAGQSIADAAALAGLPGHEAIKQLIGSVSQIR